MKCLRCGERDFDMVRASFLGCPCFECSKCKQKFLILEKLTLRYIELIGDIPNDLQNTTSLTCGSCQSIRFILQSDSALAKSIQICNDCIKAVEGDECQVDKLGDKLTWNEFFSLSKDNNQLV